MLTNQRYWTPSGLQQILESQGYILATNITRRDNSEIIPCVTFLTTEEVLNKYRSLYAEVRLEQAYDCQGKQLDPKKYASVYVRGLSVTI